MSVIERARREEREGYVGRERERERFERNLALPPDEQAVVFNVFGPGGVGKSALVRRFDEHARAAGWLTATSADARDIPDTLAALAAARRSRAPTTSSGWR